MVMVPATTPAVARHIIRVTPVAMMACCPRLRKERVIWLRVAAFSHCSICLS